MNKKSYRIIFASLFLILFTGGIFNTLSAQTTSTAVKQSEIITQLPSVYMVLPFIIILLMIATGPLFYHHFWERNYPKISIILGAVTVVYYIFYLHNTLSLMETFTEYVSFIALLGSLFVASGGILIKIDKKSTPMLNVVLLLIGAVLSNIIGTTGASMVLIRPFIKVNKDRIKPYHIVFFIFLVSNIGGALTPIGDPPLFVGFLRGINFFWFIEHIWFIWLPVIILLLLIFYIIDSKNMPKNVEVEDATFSGKVEFKGYRNVMYLGVIILSVFIDPNVFKWVPNFKPFPIGIREIIMFAVMYLSYKHSRKDILEANEFDFEPIKEVAYLFIGIFMTMVPALQLIEHEAHVLAKELDAGIFFWTSGMLSSVLDNTPTFLNFLSGALGRFGLNIDIPAQVHILEMQHALYLRAISTGAVFFGAMTYIGNGPNFMVKSITERAGIKMPSFFTYWIKYAVPVLIPTFFLVWIIFFFGRG